MTELRMGKFTDAAMKHSACSAKDAPKTGMSVRILFRRLGTFNLFDDETGIIYKEQRLLASERGG